MPRRVVVSYDDHRLYQDDDGNSFTKQVVEETTVDMLHEGVFHDRELTILKGVEIDGFLLSKSLGEAVANYFKAEHPDPAKTNTLLSMVAAAIAEQVRQ